MIGQEVCMPGPIPLSVSLYRSFQDPRNLGSQDVQRYEGGPFSGPVLWVNVTRKAVRCWNLDNGWMALGNGKFFSHYCWQRPSSLTKGAEVKQTWLNLERVVPHGRWPQIGLLLLQAILGRRTPQFDRWPVLQI